MKTDTGKYKLVINSVLPLAVVIILSYFVGRFSITKLLDLRSKVAEETRNEVVLTQKLSLLKILEPTVKENTTAAMFALPNENPSLFVVSQIKTQAVSTGVSLSNISGSSGQLNDVTNMSEARISFDAQGTRDQMFDFIKSFKSFAPITHLKHLEWAENKDSVLATVNLVSYSAGLPRSLPAITEAITNLTDDEKKILETISGLTSPTIISLEPQSAGKEDPFAGSVVPALPLTTPRPSPTAIPVATPIVVATP